jgi:hypothetical protein
MITPLGRKPRHREITQLGRESAGKRSGILISQPLSTQEHSLMVKSEDLVNGWAMEPHG